MITITCPLHTIWQGMIQRCTDPNASNFKHYGGRGIKVCEQWRRFPAFHLDMLPMLPIPPGATLDRIDVDGDYEPGNVRWATWTEQQNNKRNNRRLTFDGRTQTVANWARELGMKSQLIIDRLRMGWSVERTLSTPALGRSQQRRSEWTSAKLLTHDGLTLTQAEWARRTGLQQVTICSRLRRGWSVAQTLATPVAVSG